LKDAFENLLKDTDQDVIERMTVNLADLISVFQPRKEDVNLAISRPNNNFPQG